MKARAVYKAPFYRPRPPEREPLLWRLPPLVRFYIGAFSVVVLGVILGAGSEFYRSLWLAGFAVVVGLIARYAPERQETAAVNDSKWSFLRDTVHFRPLDSGPRYIVPLLQEHERGTEPDRVNASEDFGFRYVVRHGDLRYVPILYLQGNIDDAAVRNLRAPLVEITKHSGELMIFDLDDIWSLNDRGAEILLDVQHSAPEFGVLVRFVSTHPENLSVLDAVRRAGLKIYTSLNSALTGIPEAQG